MVLKFKKKDDVENSKLEENDIVIEENDEYVDSKREKDERKRNFINSLIILVLLIVSVYVLSNVFNNNSSKTTKNNNVVVINDTSKKLQGQETTPSLLANVKVYSANVYMVGTNYAMGVYNISQPNFTYSIEVYSIDGTKLKFKETDDPITGTISLIVYPDNTSPLSPFVIVFFENPNFTKYIIIKNVNITRVNVVPDIKSVRVIKATASDVDIQMNINVNGPEMITILPSFKESMMGYLNNELTIVLSKFVPNGSVYVEKNITRYSVCSVNESMVRLCAKDPISSSGDNIYVLKIMSKNDSVSIPIIIGVAYKLVGVYPVEVSNNTITFMLLNPFNKTISSIEVQYLMNGKLVKKSVDVSSFGGLINKFNVTLDGFSGGYVFLKVYINGSTTNFVFKF